MFNGKEEVSGDITFNVQFADDPIRRRGALRGSARPQPERREEHLLGRHARRGNPQRDAGGLPFAADDREEEPRCVDGGRHGPRRRRKGPTTPAPGRTEAAAEGRGVFGPGLVPRQRSQPGRQASDVGKAAVGILGVVLPLVYDRFSEASAKAAELKKGVDALFTVENLNGLPPVFTQLALLRDEHGKPVFKTDVDAALRGHGEDRRNGRTTASRRPASSLRTSSPSRRSAGTSRPCACWPCRSCRAGAVEAVSKGVTIDSATSTQAKDAFSNNNLFRSTSFRPKKGVDMPVRVEAADNFKETFGDEVKELTTGAIAAAIREAVERHEDDLQKSIGLLRTGRLPGGEVLENASDQIKAIRRGSEENAITTFNASHRSIRDAIKRATDLSSVLTETALLDLERAKSTLAKEAPLLLEESDLDPAVKAKVDVLRDRLAKETFFRDIAEIEQAATAVGSEYKRRYDLALDARVAAYADAVAKLEKTPGWERLDDEQKDEVARPLRQCADRAWNNQTISHLRSVTDACEGRLATAVEKVHKILDGERLATVSIGKFFSGGIENDEQLEQALVRHPRRILPPPRRRQDRDREVAGRGEGHPQRDRTGDPAGPRHPGEGLRGAVAGRLRRHAGRSRRRASGRAPDRRPAGPSRPDRRRDRAQARAGHDAERGCRRLPSRRRLHDAEPVRGAQDAGGPRAGAGVRQQGRRVVRLRQRVLRPRARPEVCPMAAATGSTSRASSTSFRPR